MNKIRKTDEPLDQWLECADQALRPSAATPDGDSIRGLAHRRAQRRRERRQALIAAGLVATLLVGWWLVKPERQPVADPTADSDVEWVKSELEEIRAQRQRLDQELQQFRARRELTRLKMAISSLQQAEFSPQTAYRRDRVAWLSLTQIAHDKSSRSLSEEDRWQLEILTAGFPETHAGAMAQSIIDNNEFPKSF